MLMRYATLPLALWAVQASAQVNSQTECRTDYFGVVRCQTQSNQTPNPYSGLNTNQRPIADSVWDSYNRAAEAAAQRRAIQEQNEAAKAQADAARAQETVAATVAAEIELQKLQGREAAKLVAAGNCAGAESYALSVGNISLAKTVRDYCADK
jgi:hypothetical protein